MNWLRSMPRPVLAMVAGIGTLLLILKDKDVPSGWWAFVGTVVTFYFIHRHDEKGGTKP